MNEKLFVFSASSFFSERTPVQRKCSQLCGNYSTCTSIVSPKLFSEKVKLFSSFFCLTSTWNAICFLHCCFVVFYHKKNMRTLFLLCLFFTNGQWYPEWLRGLVRALPVFSTTTNLFYQIHLSIICTHFFNAFQKIIIIVAPCWHCGLVAHCDTYPAQSKSQQKRSWRRKIMSWPQGRCGLTSGHVKAYPSQGQCG